eukprot:gene8229-9076_t
MKSALMRLKTEYAVLLGLLIPCALFLLLLLLVYLYRRCRHPPPPTARLGDYRKVEEDLDEEEIEFKRMIESKSEAQEEEEDYESLFSGQSLEEVNFSFSAKEKDRLAMLERLRHTLVSSSSSHPPPTATTTSQYREEDLSASSFNYQEGQGSDSEAEKLRL